MLDRKIIAELAARLDDAERARTAIVKITDEYPDMSWEDAYAVQEALKQRKLEAGHRVAGYKMGLTSYAKMQQMGVNEPVLGFLTEYGAVSDGGEISMDELIHPRIEAEIAVVTKRSLKGPGCGMSDVLSAIDFVLPALEIIDSRYKDFKFDLKSVIADNTSTSRYVVGGRSRPSSEMDLRTEGVVVEQNGKVVTTGAGAAVLGHPAKSVAMLANMLARQGHDLPAGTFIMTGGITAAITVKKGDRFSVRYQSLGTLNVSFV